MCNCFADGDIEIEEPARRHPNEPRRTRLRFVRPTSRASPRGSGELEVYRRPPSADTVVVTHHPEGTVYEEPIPTYEPVPILPAVPNPPRTRHGHHHSRSTSGSQYRQSWTPSSHDSNEPFVRIIESSPTPRAQLPRPRRNNARVITEPRRSGRQIQYMDYDSDRDSFVDPPRRRHQRREDDDDRDSWEEPRPVSRRVSGRQRSNSFTRRRYLA